MANAIFSQDTFAESNNNKIPKEKTHIIFNIVNYQISETVNLIKGLDNIEPKEQLALFLVRKSIRNENFKFLTLSVSENIIKNYVKSLLFLYAPPDLETIFNKIESESKKLVLEELEKWLKQNEIKTSSGEINFDYKNYKNKKITAGFQYIINLHPLKKNKAELAIEFYSLENLSPLSSTYNNPWDLYSFLDQNKTEIEPFVVKIKTGVEKFGSSYKSDPSYPTEIQVEFPEEVPDIRESKKTSFFDKANNLFDKTKDLAEEFSLWFKIPNIPWQAEIIKNTGIEIWDKYQVVKPEIEENEDDSSDEDPIQEEFIKETRQQEESLSEKEIFQEQDKENEETEKEPKKEEIEKEEEKEIQWCSKNNKLALQNKIIFNEIAWMGTSNSSNDEWIELKNISEKSIDLKNWQLIDKKDQIQIIFPERLIIPSGGMLILERTNDNSVPFIDADLIYTGSLNNTDESLYLFDDNCSLQDKIEANSNWPAGEKLTKQKRTMERNEDMEGWHTYSRYQNNGIWGTPKQKNSPKTEKSTENTEENTKENAGEEISHEIKRILITEIQTEGENTKQDFIELYNPLDEKVNLSSWQIKKRNQNGAESSVASFPKGSFINSKGYFLWSSSKEESYPDLIDADISRTSYITGNNSISLFNNYEEIIDCIAWGNNHLNPFFESSPFLKNPKSFQSIERKKDQEGKYIDNNDNFNDFFLQNCPNPKGLIIECYSPSYSGGSSQGNKEEEEEEEEEIFKKIVISETQKEPKEERFIELYNPNDENINLTEWYIQRKTESGNLYSFVSSPNFEGKIIEGKGLFLISSQSSSFYQKADLVTDLTITDSNTIILKNPNREISDKLGWQNAKDFEKKPAVTFSSNQSLGRKNNYQDTDNNFIDFEVQIPTPGIRNKTDEEPPKVKINSKPQKLTNKKDASFSFSANEENCIFECKKDKETWQPCSSPKKYPEIKEGEHIFYVRAIDSFSNCSEEQKYCWAIDYTLEDPSFSIFDLASLSSLYTNQNTIGIESFVSKPKEGLEWFLSEEKNPTDKNWINIFPKEFNFTSPSKDGLKTLWLWSKDKAGNTNYSKDSIILDKNPPESSFKNLKSFQNSFDFEISWSGEDFFGESFYSDILNYDLKYTTKPKDGIWINWLENTKKEKETFKANNESSYFFKVRAKDKAGNQGKWSEIKKTIIDVSKPEINFKEISSIQEKPSFSLQWHAIDPIKTVSPSGIDGFNLFYTCTPTKDSLQYQEKEWKEDEPLFLKEKSIFLEGKDENLYFFTIQAKDKAGNLSKEATSSVKITLPKPTLEIDPQEMYFEKVKFTLEPETQNLLINNKGNGLLKWNFVTPFSESWIFPEKFSGSVEENKSENLPISVKTSSLEPGNYSTTIKIDSNGGKKEIPIFLSLKKEVLPEIKINSPADNSIFTFPKNKIIIKGTSNPGNYISIQEKSLNTIADSEGKWEIELSLEERANNIDIISRNCSGKETSTHLSLYFKKPVLKINKEIFEFETLKGKDCENQKLILENIGEGNINWDIASNTVDWMSFSLQSGIIPEGELTEITITPLLNNMGSGEYETNISITSQNLEDSPFNLKINLKIKPALIISKDTILYPDEFNSLIIEGSEVILNPGEYSFENLILEDGGSLLLKSDPSLENFKGVYIKAENIDICDDCLLSANNQGYLAEEGPGKGKKAGSHGTGGSYGGKGENYGSQKSKEPYGSLSNPISLGSGGAGGKGGGVIKIKVENKLTLDGKIFCNGENNSKYGGGSGGSINIETKNFYGEGENALISSKGGNGNYNTGAGGGGGGRIAIYYNKNDFKGKIEAQGGIGPGGPGTIYLKDKNKTLGNLIIDNKGLLQWSNIPSAGTTEIPTDNIKNFNNINISSTHFILKELNAKKIEISNKSILETKNNSLINIDEIKFSEKSSLLGLPKNILNVNSKIINLSSSHILANIDIKTETLNIDQYSSISADNLGFETEEGPGKGEKLLTGSGWHGSGGSYGGKGGNYGNIQSGECYGSIKSPNNFGSGGGGGKGGGVIKIESSEIINNGKISSNGENGGKKGGGSGGSINIKSENLLGEGNISANGGEGNDSGGGGGGGGRISIECKNLNFNQGKVFSNGGEGQEPGQKGTIVINETQIQ
jgi:hypothetical protein